jgi:hypothetical protein
MNDSDKIFLELLDAIKFSNAKPTDYSDESIASWKRVMSKAEDYAETIRPKLTLQEIVDGATD